MLFNSFEFVLFLVLVFFGYWFIFNKSLRLQNLFLLVVSYIFYGWWDWRFLSLIAFSSLIDYFAGIRLSSAKGRSKHAYLLLSIFTNVGLLGVFKYFNFFAVQLSDLIKSVSGYTISPFTLDVILPVGISFYTFQTMSYTIDVYRGKMQPTKDIIAFFAYVSFFPQLVAGPIERAENLLPQFFKKRLFSYTEGVNGLRQILWGFFKKLVIADNCAILADQIFNSEQNLPGLALILGSVYFAFQIYGDFSGYSDIAIGTARLFGFHLMTNFRTPYFSRDIAEFWRRWHISLSTWFRDYVYIPLGGSRGNKANAIVNIFIIFLISGFWHGANWTFLAWGGLNAVYFLPLFILNKNRTNLGHVAQERLLPEFRDVINILMTFALTCLAWIFFRSTSLEMALDYINKIFTNDFFTPNWNFVNRKVLVLVSVMLCLEWLIYRHDDYLNRINNFQFMARHTLYLFQILAIVFFSVNEAKSFIYFQF